MYEKAHELVWVELRTCYHFLSTKPKEGMRVNTQFFFQDTFRFLRRFCAHVDPILGWRQRVKISCNADVSEIIVVSNGDYCCFELQRQIKLEKAILWLFVRLSPPVHNFYTHLPSVLAALTLKKDILLFRFLSVITQRSNGKRLDNSHRATLAMLPLLSSNTLVGVFLFLFSVPFPRLLICLLSRSISHLLPSLLIL